MNHVTSPFQILTLHWQNSPIQVSATTYLSLVVVLSFILTATLRHWNTLVITEHKAIVTNAAFGADVGLLLFLTDLRRNQTTARLRTRSPTRLIVTVRTT